MIDAPVKYGQIDQECDSDTTNLVLIVPRRENFQSQKAFRLCGKLSEDLEDLGAKA